MITFVLLNAYFDACLASFALTAAKRTLSGNKWWGSARSACPLCGHILSPAELLPLFSYLSLKGRCRHCGGKIAAEYIAAEILGAFCGAAFAARFGFDFFALSLCHTAFLFLFFSTYTDIKSGYVYDNWAYSMTLFALALRLALGGADALCGGLYGAACAFLLFFVIYLCSAKRGMGLGDACIALGTGAVLGLKLTVFALYGTFLLGAVYAVPLLVTKKATRKTALPLVPFLAAAVFMTLIFGKLILQLFGFSCPYPFC